MFDSIPPRLFGIMAAAALGACSLYGVEPPSGALQPAATAPGDELGQAVLNLSAVPDDVQCIRITAAGPGRTVAKEIDANGTAAFSQTLIGLPLGAVTFTGEAFPVAVANLLTHTHLALAPIYARLVAPGGALVLGGILAEEDPQVTGALEAAGFIQRDRVVLEGWSSLRLDRLPAPRP